MSLSKISSNFKIFLEFPIVEEKTVEVTDEEQHIHWEGYGLRLYIPHNSLPDDCSHCNFTIAVSLSRDFELPEDGILVSAVYSVTHDLGERKLKKPVTLQMQHCATSSALSGLQILRADDHSNKFSVLPGGVFSYDNHYGAIELDHFSWFCTGWFRKVVPFMFSRRYRAQFYYTDNCDPAIHTRSFKANFYILPELEAYFTVRIVCVH